MSTLRVSTIQDTAGSNSSTPAAIANGIAKAWVNFNGTGTVAIRAQFNVSSITDNGQGDYTVNFTNAMPDTNYVSIGHGSLGYSVNSSSYNRVMECPPSTTSSVRCIAYAPNNTAIVDIGYCSVSIFR